MKVYRRIASAKTLEEHDDIISEIRDRFGEIPEEIKNIIHYSEIRLKAWKLGIRKIVFEDDGVKIYTDRTLKIYHRFIRNEKEKLYMVKGDPEDILESIFSTN